MILAGVKLTLLGMTVVFLFLIILVLAVKLSFRFLSAISARELFEIEAAALKKKRRPVVKTDDAVLVAVISAAIAAHRSRTMLAR
ncbi:OadG family protein [uncultured Desulfosarcina sp.]|uniref:OadG family protein n=1 Tax=uncultured Desulfosarcina sp. TaxID=218289 RepID=UPI0029C7CA26|nr:OadG family protein [uncultured Desulfosarcina sp.]